MRSVFPAVLTLATLAVIAMAFPMPDSVLAASTPSIAISVEHAAPREIEETTQKALARDYAAAWQTMTEALDQNRADLLSTNFIGTADDKLTATIQQQTKAGLHQHITDQGHTVDAVFYSPEGSAIELHDIAHLQIDVMDGSKVIHTENATVHYVALLTAAENSWKVRVLEGVPGF
ncbi:MAG: hypothetical protein WBW69_02910 [Candidatus Korobacteraceae bacterium]